MSMTSELVKELRKYAEEYKNLPWSEVCEKTKRILNCAADTIEELSAKVARQNMERSSQYYGGGWIPCSERLPEERKEITGIMISDVVLVTAHSIIQDEKFVACDFTVDAKWTRENDYSKVLAWQPLPPAFEQKED